GLSAGSPSGPSPSSPAATSSSTLSSPSSAPSSGSFSDRRPTISSFGSTTSVKPSSPSFPCTRLLPIKKFSEARFRCFHHPGRRQRKDIFHSGRRLRIDILTRRRFGDFFSGDQGDGGEVLGPQTSDNIVVTFFGIEAVPQRVEQEGEVFCSKAFEECEF